MGPGSVIYRGREGGGGGALINHTHGLVRKEEQWPSSPDAVHHVFPWSVLGEFLG